MIKTIIKELFIFILLLIAIGLILSVIFYEYIPTNKTLPEKVSYTTSEDVKAQLENVTVDTEEIVMTHTINSSDLTSYINVSGYTPGKVNPFSSYVTEDEPSGDGGSTSTGGSSSGSSSSGSSSGGQYFDDEGTK